MLALLVGCDQIRPKEGVGEVLGLKFGVPLNLKIKEGPREPPWSARFLREFYTVDFPNMEFEFVGVAVTKNDDASRKEGFVFNQEDLIWGAFFSTAKPCDEKDHVRTKEYLAKNWKTTLVLETRHKPEESYLVMSALTSPNVSWLITCAAVAGLELIVQDFSVVKNAGNEKIKKGIDKMLSEENAKLQRKM